MVILFNVIAARKTKQFFTVRQLSWRLGATSHDITCYETHYILATTYERSGRYFARSKRGTAEFSACNQSDSRSVKDRRPEVIEYPGGFLPTAPAESQANAVI
jgi:hypothetical protein